VAFIVTAVLIVAAVLIGLFVVQQGAAAVVARRRVERYSAKLGHAVAVLHNAADTPGVDRQTGDALRIEARRIADFMENGGTDA
jgi:hypothetical protein